MQLTQAMILGAGLGTRLRPLTLELPKPAMPFGDTPLFALQFAQLQSAGFHVAAMNASYMHEVLAPLAAGIGLPLSLEQEPLGTAGAIACARINQGNNHESLLGVEPTLVHNGDVYTRTSWSALQGDLQHAIARLAVRDRPLGQGSVGWNDAMQVVRLRGVSVAPEAHSGDFLGVHLMGHCAVRLCATGCLVGDVYTPAMIQGARIEVVISNEPVWDIGDPASYHAAVMDWGGAGWTSPGAELQASTVHSVVSAGARVLADIENVVVWPGAVVREPLKNAIVTPRCIVQL